MQPRTERIRVLLHDAEHLLGDLAEHAFRNEPDVEVVARTGSPLALHLSVAFHRPDVVVVVDCDGGLPPDYMGLFSSTPGLRLLSLRADGTVAHLYELWLHRVRTRDLSPSDLVRSVRAVANDTHTTVSVAALRPVPGGAGASPPL